MHLAQHELAVAKADSFSFMSWHVDVLLAPKVLSFKKTHGKCGRNETCHLQREHRVANATCADGLFVAERFETFHPGAWPRRVAGTRNWMQSELHPEPVPPKTGASFLDLHLGMLSHHLKK